MDEVGESKKKRSSLILDINSEIYNFIISFPIPKDTNKHVSNVWNTAVVLVAYEAVVLISEVSNISTLLPDISLGSI